MSWTVACFCGNVYTAPPDRCVACGSTLRGPGPRDAAIPPTARAANVHVGVVIDAGLRAQAVPSLHG